MFVCRYIFCLEGGGARGERESQAEPMSSAEANEALYPMTL